MKIVGVIAEFNPMHYGHKYLLEKAKEITNSDIAICIMSGNFTQAGNMAVQDKFTRARIAIENGFDAVIELPVIFATASAQYFANGAISILNNLPIDYICFGSETGDIEELKEIATTLIQNNNTIWESITESMKEGISFAKSREYAISKYLTAKQVKVATSSNNILGIEYLKNLIELNSNIIPIAIKRESNYSATDIRNMIQNKSDISSYALNSEIILNSPLNNEDMFNIIKYNIVSNKLEYIKQINEVTEGLENKLLSEINNSSTYDEFTQNVKSKRYQLSKIKRILINILLKIDTETFLELTKCKNIYAHILTINPSKKNELLSYLNKNSKIPIITKITDENNKSLMLDIYASNVYSIIKNDKIQKDYTNKL